MISRVRERGAAAVEMALVLPLLCLLLFGIIDVSRMLSGTIAAEQGAREGVRLAALAPTYTATEAKARAENASVNPFAGTLTASVTMCPTTVDLTKEAAVTVNFNYSGILFFGGGHTFSRTAKMRCGG